MSPKYSTHIEKHRMEKMRRKALKVEAGKLRSAVAGKSDSPVVEDSELKEMLELPEESDSYIQGLLREKDEAEHAESAEDSSGSYDSSPE